MQGDHGVYDVLHGRIDCDFSFLVVNLGTGGDVAVRGEKNRISIDGDVPAKTFVRVGGEVAIFKGDVSSGINCHIAAFSFAGFYAGVDGAVMGQ